MSDKRVSDIIQSNHPDTYIMDRKLFRIISREATSTEDNKVAELIKEKFKELIHG